MPTANTVLGPIHVDDQGGADRPVALLWPSLFKDHRMWDAQVAALRAAGWRTLALDPPGHGQSPGPGRRFTMDECAEAAIQVLDASGVRTPVLLFGTSWGGIVAPRVALRAAGRVRGMVLFNSTAERPTLFSRVSARLLTAMLSIRALDGTVNRMVPRLQLAKLTRSLRPEIEAEMVTRFRAWDRRALIATVRAVLVDRDGVLDRLSAVTAPALIISGAQDTLLPSAFSRRMAQALPNARHVEVPDVAHLTPVEAPDAANALILEFIERLV